MEKSIYTIALYKFVFCVVASTLSASVSLYIRGKHWEVGFLKAALLLGSAGKIILCIVVYTLVPQWNATSDAALWYIWEARAALAGKLPYTDYPSNYSILFGALLALPVSVWNSVGAIVLLNVMLECIMLWLYIRRPARDDSTQRWRVAFLYCYSPISVYWLDIGGYNGGIIQFGTFLALWLSERGRPWWSGVVAGLSFSVTKLLALLSWPAVVLYDRSSWRQRAIPAGLTLAAIAALLLLGIDIFMPVRREFHKYTSGNIWYFFIAAFPAFRNTAIFQYAPVVLFVILFLPALLAYWRRDDSQRLGNQSFRNPVDGFDEACAFAGFTNLLFMICSKKAYTFYLPMCLLPILHATLTGGKDERRALYALIVLGATTTIEDSLWTGMESMPDWSLMFPRAQALFALDLAIVGAYLCLLLTCRRRFLRNKPSTMSNLVIADTPLKITPLFSFMVVVVTFIGY